MNGHVLEQPVLSCSLEEVSRVGEDIGPLRNLLEVVLHAFAG